MGTELNTTALLDLAQALETEDVGRTGGVGFNMRFYMPTGIRSSDGSCKTACCIAGWSHLLSGGSPDDRVLHGVQREYLGLTDDQAEELFCPSGYENFDPLTPAHAAAVIRHLVASGEVDWHRFDGLSPEAELEDEAQDEDEES